MLPESTFSQLKQSYTYITSMHTIDADSTKSSPPKIQPDGLGAQAKQPHGSCPTIHSTSKEISGIREAVWRFPTSRGPRPRSSVLTCTHYISTYTVLYLFSFRRAFHMGWLAFAYFSFTWLFITKHWAGHYNGGTNSTLRSLVRSSYLWKQHGGNTNGICHS